MFSSRKISKIFGISIFIHWTFWLLPIWVLLTSRDSGIGPGTHLLALGALFSFVLMHELGHAQMARHFGIRTRRITLCPLGGMAQLERMSKVPWEEFCIAVAGPLVNVFLAAVFGSILLGAYSLNGNVLETSFGQFLGFLLLVNLGMVIFNMLPAFPMDGGRVLRAVLSSMLGLLPGTRAAVQIGSVVAVLMGFAGVFLLGNYMIPLIAIFIIWAGNQELRALEARAEGEGTEVPPQPAVVLPAWRVGKPTAHVTICIWEPRTGEWHRQSLC